MHNITLGEKVKNFRNRAGLSQLDLEISIDAAQGSISRIENGKVNPTKETLLSIAKELKLTAVEIAYLTGITFDPPSEEEIESAKKVFQDLLDDPNVLGYLLDQYTRVVAFSSGFKILARINNINIENIIGHSVIEVLFDPSLGIRGIFDKNKFDETAVSVLAVIQQDRKYLSGGGWYEDLIHKLELTPDFKRLWEKTKKESVPLYSTAARTVFFELNGVSTPMVFHITNYHQDPRFMFIEYTQ